jgi:hypothetical protein
MRTRETALARATPPLPAHNATWRSEVACSRSGRTRPRAPPPRQTGGWESFEARASGGWSTDRPRPGARAPAGDGARGRKRAFPRS